jgi:chromosome segregation ATPase
MCHRHLKVDFAPKMNFIVGHNGSERGHGLQITLTDRVSGGKSAILTAIAVTLGGKASFTGRGHGLKDLIRRGAE